LDGGFAAGVVAGAGVILIRNEAAESAKGESLAAGKILISQCTGAPIGTESVCKIIAFTLESAFETACLFSIAVQPFTSIDPAFF
jgi:hypothetical protein